MDTNSIKAKAVNFAAKPGVRLTAAIFADIALIAVGALVGYRVGKTVGESKGVLRGQNETLDKLGITHSDVPDVAAAWAESRATMDTVMAQQSSSQIPVAA